MKMSLSLFVHERINNDDTSESDYYYFHSLDNKQYHMHPFHIT